MLLEELLKYTAEENEDYPNIAAALDIVRHSAFLYFSCLHVSCPLGASHCH
jgi:hypothetical protein